MKIEDYINLGKTESKKEIDGVSLIKSEVLEYKETTYKDPTMPEGYQKSVRWFFSDGSVIVFDDETDTEPGWKAHNRCWKFEVIGSRVSCDSSVGIISKRGCV